jgi:uncharacterized protein DUF4386
MITRADARRTAVLYLLMGLPGIPALMSLPDNFIVRGDPAATMQRITEGAFVYRLIVLGYLSSMIFFIVLGWKLYQLFERVDKRQAQLLVLFVLVSAAFALVDVVLLLTPLTVQASASSLAAFTKPQLDALAFGALRLRNPLILVNQAFWGLWLLPFGILVIKSGYIPKFIGALLFLGFAAWVVLSASGILFPSAHLVERIVFPLTAPGELSILLWLIVKSLSRERVGARQALAAT